MVLEVYFGEDDGIATKPDKTAELAKAATKQVGKLPFIIAKILGGNTKYAEKIANAPLKGMDIFADSLHNWKTYSGMDLIGAESLDIVYPLYLNARWGSSSAGTIYGITKSHNAALLAGVLGVISSNIYMGEENAILTDSIKKERFNTDIEKEDKEKQGKHL